MRKQRRGRYTPPRSHDDVGGLIDPATVPAGFVVVGDGFGNERMVYAPEMVEAMRECCPMCSGDDGG